MRFLGTIQIGSILEEALKLEWGATQVGWLDHHAVLILVYLGSTRFQNLRCVLFLHERELFNVCVALTVKLAWL